MNEGHLMLIVIGILAMLILFLGIFINKKLEEKNISINSILEYILQNFFH